MPRRLYATGAYSSKYSTDISVLVAPSFYNKATTKVIISCHGRGVNGAYAVNGYVHDPMVSALVSAGYAVLGIDHARINSYADPDAMRALDDAYAYLVAQGFNASKIGLTGHSMGGGTALNWIRRNPSKVACAYLFNPLLDLQFFAKTSAEYTPPYSVAGVTPTTAYNAEILATYAASSTVVGTPTIPAVGNAGVNITIADPPAGSQFSDGLNGGSLGLPIASVMGSTFTYTGKTNTTLIGCVATGAVPIVVTNGAAVTATYDQAYVSYQIYNDAAAIGALGVPIKISQASDDTTVPPAAANDAAVGFIALANSPKVTKRTPVTTGGHLASVVSIPPAEIVSFFQVNL